VSPGPKLATWLLRVSPRSKTDLREFMVGLGVGLVSTQVQ
jgi:hypothetical protein